MNAITNHVDEKKLDAETAAMAGGETEEVQV
jgi:hypothetical protein